jgi:signal transduction histidine kinase/DNA-binding response OmpR family regulator
VGGEWSARRKLEPRMTERLNVLQIEDDESDAELVRMALMDAGFALEWTRVDDERSLESALDRHQQGSQDWDVVLSDFAMPGFSGVRAFEICRARKLDVPFIFVSGALGEERAVAAMRAGARDYFLKGRLTRLGEAVRRELHEARQRRLYEEAEDHARRERRRLALAIEASGAGVFEIGRDDASPVDYGGSWRKIMGVSARDLPVTSGGFRAWLADSIHPDDAAALDELLALCAGRRESFRAEFRLRLDPGTGPSRWTEVGAFASLLRESPDDPPDHVAGLFIDLSARRQLEEQLRQAQKMEAVGQLAGGVAHDFNNLLTVILSFTAFASEELGPTHPATADLAEILKAGERARALTSQLLAFSRKTPVSPRVLNLNDIVRSAERMLRRVLTENIDVVTSFDPGLGNARLDGAALEQVLMNLTVNARDAMPRGGTLTFETQNVELEEAQTDAHDARIPPGNYVTISISDSGVGMDAATQARIFEPFFTTKDTGRGTGLGLSTCYGIVKQAGGFFGLYSEVGHGTTFRIYLPRVLGPTESFELEPDPVDLRGNEVILMVEDDDQVRLAGARTLSQLGYTVFATADGAEALARFGGAGPQVNLLLTDVIMPNLSGKDLVSRIRQMDPTIRVLYISGYAPAAFVHRGMFDEGTPILQKPFTPSSLARKVRQVLSGRSGSQPVYTGGG